MSATTNLAIIRRHGDYQFSEPPTTSADYSFVAASIYLSLELLHTPHVRQCLARQAVQYDQSLEQPGWYGRLQEDMTLSLNLVDSFLDAVSTTFPLVCIDETIPTIDWLADHPRGEWSGIFNPRAQAVCINARRVDDMVASATSPDSVNFRIFQFLFAHTFLHEVGGHMLITYLSGGRRPLTPPEMGHGLYGTEAGRALERVAFRGALEYYCDFNQDDHQPGIPHLLYENGTVQRISQAFIDGFTNGQIYFPYTMEGDVQDVNCFQPMGREVIINGLGLGPFTMSHSLTRGYRVRVDDIRRVLQDSRVRISAVS
ncbi:hypothetical protein AJ79_09554 [Helicocarpus griseus UAMH5409]|uniref:Uncharacterized protein n=1 Tax=Helicocarpus griseus UAMH5409 TaxID=1447875 RepID=A0A2B7WIT1_9EURO|nr:hypothetical protein AJ79_09554 [Helicocarpus griseus UAMH5409]